MKKVIFLTSNGKIIDVLDVKTVDSYEDYKKLVDEAKLNKKELEAQKENERIKKETDLNNRIEELYHNVQLANLEISLLRGKITEEEYNERMEELCGTK